VKVKEKKFRANRVMKDVTICRTKMILYLKKKLLGVGKSRKENERR